MKKLLALMFLLSIFYLGCAHDLSVGYGVSAKKYSEEGNYEKVVEQARQSVTLNPNNGSGWYWLGEGYVHTGKYKEAIPALQKALTLISDTPAWATTINNTYFRLGDAYFNLGNYDDSIVNYSKAIDRNPRYMEALAWRGWAKVKQGKYIDAGRDFERALMIDSNNQTSRHGRAWTLYYQGDFDGARKEFEYALQLNPAPTGAKLNDILVGKAFSYIGLGDSETALSVMQKASQANKNPNESTYFALIYHAAGDKEKASSYWGGKGRLGLEVSQSDNSKTRSVNVVKVERGSPAEQAGMLARDQVLIIDGTPITTVQEFVARARALTPGNNAKLRIEREGLEKDINIRVGTALEQMESHPLLAPILAKIKSVQPAAVATSALVLQPAEPLPAPVITSDVDMLPVVTIKSKQNSYAIVIGVERYRQKLPKADFAVRDAKIVSEYLSKVMGYPEENIVTLTNENASKGDLEKYFDQWLKNVVEKNASVFVYYSGHGAPNAMNGDAYLVPYDGDPAFIEQTGYSLKRLYENLSKLPAKNVIVALDACFSGAGGKSVAAKGSRALVRVEKTSARNIAVLTASQDNQISSSYEEKGHGVFTYFLLKGIKELLGEDNNSKLELGELYNYLKPQVERTSRRLYNNEQTPQLMTADEQMKKIGLRP